MQQRLIEAAEAAGAEVRRGVIVRGVETGPQPSVIAEYNGRTETIAARFVAGADGRGSRVREWLGFKPNRDPDCLVIAGILLDGMNAPDTSVHVFRDSSEGIGALLFPLGENRVRTYYIYRKRGERQGLSGNAKVPKFIDACIELGVPAEWLDGAEAAGPLAEFDGADTWIDRPYRDGVALIGDAASSNDPSWGNGLSLTLRDVRALRDALLASDDWESAGQAYGKAHEQHFGVVRNVTRWLTNMLYEIGPEADARRARAFPLMQTDRSRSPDYIALGPETPHDEAARRRYYGEE